MFFVSSSQYHGLVCGIVDFLVILIWFLILLGSQRWGVDVWVIYLFSSTVKPMLNGHSQKDRKSVFKTNYPLMQVKSIAECSNGSILQYFWPSLSYNLSLRSLFCLFLSGRFTQGLLYTTPIYINNTVLGVHAIFLGSTSHRSWNTPILFETSYNLKIIELTIYLDYFLLILYSTMISGIPLEKPGDR